RFRSVRVDEFQDPNRLQCELVDLLVEGHGAEEIFFVGDEFQSIYGFRHADVEVFRGRRSRAVNLLALTRNYRSRPEVLAAVNHLFEPEFGDGFQPLAASGEFPDPVFGQPVELLVTDKASFADSGEHWRRAEAKHVLLRRHAGRRPLFSGLERALPPALSADDERLLRAFRQRYERLAAASTRLSLERLCERIVEEHDYDLAVLGQWDGRRRYANMRKLARLARSYQELRGPDIEGFVRFVRDQEALGARELEAVAEEEGADAVRLLTIHAAKGLEFKVVVVA